MGWREVAWRLLAGSECRVVFMAAGRPSPGHRQHSNAPCPCTHLPSQVQLHDNAGEVSISSGGGDIQLFLNPAVAGRLLLRNCARVAAHPGTVRLSHPQADGSLSLALPLAPAAGVAGGAGAAPRSRLQRAAAAAAGKQQQLHREREQEGPPPGNVVTTARRVLPAGGAQITLDAGGSCEEARSAQGTWNMVAGRNSSLAGVPAPSQAVGMAPGPCTPAAARPLCSFRTGGSITGWQAVDLLARPRPCRRPRHGVYHRTQLDGCAEAALCRLMTRQILRDCMAFVAA